MNWANLIPELIFASIAVFILFIVGLRMKLKNYKWVKRKDKIEEDELYKKALAELNEEFPGELNL